MGERERVVPHPKQKSGCATACEVADIRFSQILEE